jgi:catechol 2,3-dioxygenase
LEKLVSKLSYVGITTPKLEASANFYRDMLGLEISREDADTVWFRGWGECYMHCVKLMAGEDAGLHVVGWRAQGAEQLEIAVRRLETSGHGLGWVDAEFGRGRAYRYKAPAGEHLHEIFWDVERYTPPPELVSAVPNRPQRYIQRGIGVREIDHVTVSSRGLLKDVAFFRDTLGHRYMEYVNLEETGQTVFAMTTTGERGHDMAFLPDAEHLTGRVNHIAFWVDQRDELYRCADLFLDAGVPIEFGPGRHGLGEQEYLYVREPSGLRVEINAGGYRNAVPDWQPVGWVPSQGANDWYRNVPYPRSMFQSFPLEKEGKRSNQLYTDHKGIVQ